MALLVGMSPREIRRLEKKKGLKLKRYNGNSFQIHAQTNESDIILSSDVHNSKESSEDGDANDIDNEQWNTSMNDTDEAPHEKKKGLKLKRYNGKSFQIQTQTNESDINLSSVVQNSKELSVDSDANDIDNEQWNASMNDTDADRLPGANEGASLASGGEQSFDRVEALNMESDFSWNQDNGCRNAADENGGDYCSSRPQEVLSFKGAKKLSLLGHGPHGKQVVEHLLYNYGEDGVSQFCQKWRQVFVEAVRPRFLPPGWDTMHSEEVDKVELLYTGFVSLVKSDPVILTLLPLSPKGEICDVNGACVDAAEDELFRLTSKEGKLTAERETVRTPTPSFSPILPI